MQVGILASWKNEEFVTPWAGGCAGTCEVCVFFLRLEQGDTMLAKALTGTPRLFSHFPQWDAVGLRHLLLAMLRTTGLPLPVTVAAPGGTGWCRSPSSSHSGPGVPEVSFTLHPHPQCSFAHQGEVFLRELGFQIPLLWSLAHLLMQKF